MEGAETAATPQLYTEEEVLRHFSELLPALELRQEIAALGCGLDGFFKRRGSLREFTAMCVALWELALERSFPRECEVFFHNFLAASPIFGKGRGRERSVALVKAYAELFALKKDSDFSPVARYMVKKLKARPEDEKVLHLKISLTIRKLYQTIFNYLI